MDHVTAKIAKIMVLETGYFEAFFSFNEARVIVESFYQRASN